MTLLVVLNDVIYCDSFCTNGADASTCNKIRTTAWGSNQITYSCAGSPDAASELMEFLADIQPSSWLTTDISRFGGDSNNTIVIFRVPNSDRPAVVALGETHPRISAINSPQDNGLQFMCGSGWNWFHAFFTEHGDLNLALELTAKHHRDVEAPFQSF